MARMRDSSVPLKDRSRVPLRREVCREKDRNYSATMSTNELLKRITIDPGICHGKPCIRGLRYPVAMLLELMSSGMSHDEILADYEDLEREDLLAALAYAARVSDAKRVTLVE